MDVCIVNTSLEEVSYFYINQFNYNLCLLFYTVFNCVALCRRSEYCDDINTVNTVKH